MRSQGSFRASRAFLAVMTAAVLAGAAACGSVTPVYPSQVDVPFSTTDLIVGTGDPVTAGKTVTVLYTGWLYDASKPDNKGTEFDTNETPVAPVLTFVLGTGQVIPGFDQGITGMRVGGRRRIVIPPSLGFGASQVGSIPPNSTIIFEVTLSVIQ